MANPWEDQNQAEETPEGALLTEDTENSLDRFFEELRAEIVAARTDEERFRIKTSVLERMDEESDPLEKIKIAERAVPLLGVDKDAFLEMYRNTHTEDAADGI